MSLITALRSQTGSLTSEFLRCIEHIRFCLLAWLPTWNLPVFIVAPQRTNLTIESNPKNTTVCLNSSLTLLCVTNANPPVLYHLYFNENYIGNSSSGEFNITVEGDGVYTCVPINTMGTGNNDTLIIIAVGELPCIFYYTVAKVSHGG